MNYIRVFDEIFHRFDGPRFSVRFWNGTESHYGSGNSDTFILTVRNPDTVKRLLAQGSIGFGEAYMDGSLKIEGDLESYLNLRHYLKKGRPSLYFTIAALWARINVPHDRKSQISHHYDLGNDFFKLMLDKETMSYSSGRYVTGQEFLSVAQKNKLECICQWLRLHQGASVLDLGSGWGGFAKYASENYQWHIKGYTLSQEQLNYCKELLNDNRLVSFEYHDMLNISSDAIFDGAVMIESIEHVGQKNLLKFFHEVKKHLHPGAPFIIQSTVRCKLRSVDRWTLKYIFPGGYLPSKQELIDLATQAGFIVEEIRDDTRDYIYTVTEWIKNFEENHAYIENKFGEPFYRMWKLWIYGTKVSFETESIGLCRLHLKLPK